MKGGVYGPCAKRQVRCVIVTLDGVEHSGANNCRNSQVACPREPWEDYEKCRSICEQEGHAEIVALRIARQRGADLKGATAWVSGHHSVCSYCGEALKSAGLNMIVLALREAQHHE